MSENWGWDPEFLAIKGKKSILPRQGAIDPRAKEVRKSKTSKTLIKSRKASKSRYQSPPPKVKKLPKAPAARSLIAQLPLEDGGNNKAAQIIAPCEMTVQWS